jgi:hypothetical protein
MGMSTTYRVRLPDGRTYGPAGMDLLQQWAREGRLTGDAVLIPGDGSGECMVAAMESLRPHVLAPPTVFMGLPPPPDDSGLSTIIPYRNVPALTGYYIGIAALIPFVGLLAGPLALGLGVSGYRRSRNVAHAKGAVHAWIAIVRGALTTLANWGLAVALVVLSMA